MQLFEFWQTHTRIVTPAVKVKNTFIKSHFSVCVLSPSLNLATTDIFFVLAILIRVVMYPYGFYLHSHKAAVRTGHGITDWFQIGKGVHQACILSPCLFNLYVGLYHVKCWAAWSTSWNQDCGDKYQQPQICQWHHPNGRKGRGTKEPLVEGKRREWKSWLKSHHSKS